MPIHMSIKQSMDRVNQAVKKFDRLVEGTYYDQRHQHADARIHYPETLTDETMTEMASHWCDKCHDYLKETTEEVGTRRFCSFHRYDLFPNYFDKQGDVIPIKQH